MRLKIVESTLMTAMITLVGMFDPYGIAHAKRVTDLTIRLAERYGITDPIYLEILRKACMLHDIGKMEVPEYVRRMTGTYLPSERTMMNEHSMNGSRYLGILIDGIITEEAVQIVKHHHQDWGGKEGYPDPKLKGDDIPLGARLIRPCDWFDAVTHERGYKRASTPQDALAEMIDLQITTQPFDPDILRLFIEMMRLE